MLIILVMVFQLNVQAAAVPMPILPYVPPSKVQLYDLLNNVYGLTRLNIEDDVKRLAAYIDLYTRIMGQANADIIDRMLDSSYSNRKYIIKAELMNGVQSVMNEQVTTGVELFEQTATSGTSSLSDAEANYIVSELAKVNIQQTAAQLKARYTKAKNSIGNDLTVCVWVTKTGSHYAIWQGFYKAAYGATWSGSAPWGYNVSGSTYLFQSGSDIKYNNAYGTGGVYDGKIALKSTSFWEQHIMHINFGKVSSNRKATAQSSAISTALTNSTDIPVTAASEVNNGVLDTTKDVVINLPVVLPVPASNVNDLEDVQDDLGVVPLPLTQDVAATVTDLQGTQAAQLGDTSTYAIDLTEYFPFCIPFDIGNLLTLFVAEPEAPTFTFQLPVGYDTNDGFLWETYTLDLSQFDQVALWCRRGMLLIFIVGLGLSTRQVFLRG